MLPMLPSGFRFLQDVRLLVKGAIPAIARPPFTIEELQGYVQCNAAKSHEIVEDIIVLNLLTCALQSTSCIGKASSG